MGVFERQGNSSSFKGVEAAADAAATGVGFTLKTHNVKPEHQFQSFLFSDYNLMDVQLHVCDCRGSQHWKVILFRIRAPHCSHCERGKKKQSRELPAHCRHHHR